MAKNKEAEKKMTKARAGLVIDHPFFGALALKLLVVEDETAPTMWVNGVTMGYNPNWVLKLSADELKFVLAHEVMHCGLAHHARRGARNPGKWNEAGDYAINQILVNSKVGMMPKKGLINPAYQDMSADKIYPLIPENQNGKGGKGQGAGGDGDGSGQGQDQGPNSDPGGCGEVRDAPTQGHSKGKLTESEAKQAEQDWKIAVQQAAQSARMQGKLPAGMDRLINDLVNPVIDWREVLQRFIDTAARNDYSWSRPNRRYLSQGITVPSLYSEELGDIVIAVDTSGSIAMKELVAFASEISGILQDYQCKIYVMYCDTKVYEENIEEYTSDDLPIEMHPKGGGGTDFIPPFKWVDKNNITPTCFIYFTDMWCNSFPKEPDYPVLWAATERGYGAPPFGEIVKVVDYDDKE